MGAAPFPWASVPLYHNFKGLPRFTARFFPPPPTKTPFALIIKPLAVRLDASAPRHPRLNLCTPKGSAHPTAPHGHNPLSVGRAALSGDGGRAMGKGQGEAPWQGGNKRQRLSCPIISGRMLERQVGPGGVSYLYPTV